MYNAILSTFGSENKLCRAVNCKSGMAALNALVCGQFIEAYAPLSGFLHKDIGGLPWESCSTFLFQFSACVRTALAL